MPQPLDKIARQLRSAILAADHVAAERVANEYALAVKEAWESLSASERARSTLPAQANELFTWARGMTIVQRAMLAEQLAVLQKSMRYGWDGSARPRPTIQMSV
jgi:hypothetical protein